jgi:hypothetical protein
MSSYKFRNVQALIMAKLMFILYVYHHQEAASIFDDINEKISDGEFLQVDFALRALTNFIEILED